MGPKTQTPVEWPFVGRVDELAEVDAARRGGSRSVVIAGPSGVGKTRLARTAAEQAEADGWRIEWAVGTEAARDLPLGAFLHLVPDGRAARGEALLGAIVDSISERDPAVATMLVVDDAHLLDPASATLVHRLAFTGRAFVVLTLRSGEQPVDAIRLLWRDDASSRVELAPFGLEATAQLAAALLGGPVDTATREFLFSSTRGNALYLRELVREGVRQGLLAPDGERWRWRGPLVASAGLDELVSAHIAELDAEARAALELVALCEPIGFSVAQQLANRAALARLEEERLIDLVDDGRRKVVRCAHPLHGEVVRARVGSARRDDIRRSFGDVVELTGTRRSDDVIRLVRLRLDAGDKIAPDLLRRAARQAWTVGHLGLLEEICNALVQIAPDVEAEYLLGEISVDRGDVEAALVRWAPLEDADVDDELYVQIAKARATVMASVFGRTEEATGVLDRAIARVPDTYGLLHATRVTIDVHWAAPSVPAPTGAPNDETAVLMWIANARVQVMAGACDDVADDATPIEEIARRASSAFPLALTFVQLLRYFALIGGGRFDAALTLAQNALATSVGDERVWARAYWTEAHGLIALERGLPRDALPYQEEAISAYRENDNGQLRNALSQLAMTRALCGDVAGARLALEEMEAANAGVVGPYVTEGRSRAACLAAEGRSGAAADLVIEEASRNAAEGLALFEAYARLDACRYGRAREHAPRLRAVAAPMQGPLPAAFAQFGDALASGDADALVAAAEALERAGCGLYAAEAMTAAARAARAARRRDAFALADRAGALVVAAGHPHTPLLAGGVETAPLTPREREVAMLAVGGAPDREIAQTLGVSVRTVNAHLRAVYTKLGITSRTDLTTILGTTP